jgi:hypothetical protein
MYCLENARGIVILQKYRMIFIGFIMPIKETGGTQGSIQRRNTKSSTAQFLLGRRRQFNGHGSGVEVNCEEGRLSITRPAFGSA